MTRTMSIDIETYSSVDLNDCGVYRYTESEDFDILLFAYSYDSGPIEVIELACGDELSDEIIHDLCDTSIIKKAYNAQFERVCLSKYLEMKLEPSQWRCTMAHAAMCGLPGSLSKVAEVLKLKEQKMKAGKELIKFFSCPCKPTKKNGGRTRNFPYHDMDRWKVFVEYNRQDVATEMEIAKFCDQYPISDFEKKIYMVDQKINDTGIRIDTELVDSVLTENGFYINRLEIRAKQITGLGNPNSLAQLKSWIKSKGLDITSLTKDDVTELIKTVQDPDVKEVLKIRQEMGKTSVSKYEAMDRAVCDDGRVRGVLQYYGANKTGRWAGRLIQVQNLPRNSIKELNEVRDMVIEEDFETLECLYDSVSDIFSQLIRTAFIPSEGYTFVISDYSAIEARVIAWLAKESWREEVFRTHGKIYEASAAQMFHIPIEQVTKDSDYRKKGKVAELALGYQGAKGALAKMGGEKMGLTDKDMTEIVSAWRKANKNIVKLWKDVEECCCDAIENQSHTTIGRYGVGFIGYQGNLMIHLPSKRSLIYQQARVENGKISYMGMNQMSRKWEKTDTYGGKLVENIVQAIARDCLALTMQRLQDAGYRIVMHIHDEVVVEVPKTTAEADLKLIKDIMDTSISWADGLKLNAEAFISEYYKKD